MVIYCIFFFQAFDFFLKQTWCWHFAWGKFVFNYQSLFWFVSLSFSHHTETLNLCGNQNHKYCRSLLWNNKKRVQSTTRVDTFAKAPPDQKKKNICPILCLFWWLSQASEISLAKKETLPASETQLFAESAFYELLTRSGKQQNKKIWFWQHPFTPWPLILSHHLRCAGASTIAFLIHNLVCNNVSFDK